MVAMISAVMAIGALVAPTVQAHGWIEVPLARQFCNGDQAKWSVATSGGNGAKTAVVGGGGSPYGGMPGLCGDPFESRKTTSNFVGMPCEPQETYQQGSNISVQIDVSANHGGFWELSICDSKDLSQACFDRNKLTAASTGSTEWYIMDRKLGSPIDSYTADWVLPPGLVCDHCVMQWTWWTAHNCVFECDKAVCGFYAERKSLIPHPEAKWDMAICDSRNPAPGQKPQIFRNCADLKIVGNGATVAIPTDPVMDTADADPVDPVADPIEPEAAIVEQAVQPITMPAAQPAEPTPEPMPEQDQDMGSQEPTPAYPTQGYSTPPPPVVEATTEEPSDDTMSPLNHLGLYMKYYWGV